MKRFYSKLIGGRPAANWPAIQAEAGKYGRALIEICDADAAEAEAKKAEISDQQRKWLHCKAGPVRALMADGWGSDDAKNHLKVKHGRDIFVREVTEENFKKAKGELFWECQIAVCRKLIHPAIVVFQDGKRACPICGSEEIKLIAIRSIMDTSVKKINKWFDNIFSAMPGIKPPNPDWYIDEAKANRKQVKNEQANKI